MNKTGKKRVMVIGLDGATFEIIEPMVRQGKLKNLARLMRTSAYGRLKSTMPPITPCAWTSAVTGKDPSKHGLYDFAHHEGDPEKTKNVNSTFVKAKAIWKILTEAGKRSIVIDVPLTYPAEKINGIMISRVMAPPKKNCTYPKTLYQTLIRDKFIEKPEEKKLADVHGAGAANKEEKKAVPAPKKFTKRQMAAFGRKRIRKAFKNMKEEIEKNIRLVKGLINKEDWDFFMIVFMSADHAGHTFWKDQDKVRKIYEKLDWALGRIFSLVGDETTMFIISDHGFTSVPYEFNINEWLFNKGLLVKKLDIPSKESMKELKGFLKAKRLGRAEEPGAKCENKLSKFRYVINTDYSKSKVYLQSGTSYGLRINLEGRDRTGIVKKEDYETLREWLIKELSKEVHPMTGKKVFSDFYKKEDVYSISPDGTDPSPDLFFWTTDTDIIVNGSFKQVARVFAEGSKGYGFHGQYGILYAAGKEIVNKKIVDAKITDLAPTILKVLEVPLPDDLDGRILTEAFIPGSSVGSGQVSYQGPSIIEKKETAYSKKDEEKINKRLAALGYIE